MVNSQLLITFTNNKKLEETIQNIKNTYTIIFNKIYVLENESNTKDLICSYNVDLNFKIDENNIPPKTIGVHRKKSSNTLYTINALNHLVSLLNDGKLDAKFQIPWENYKHCILVTNNGEFKKIKTRLNKIVEIDSISDKI